MRREENRACMWKVLLLLITHASGSRVNHAAVMISLSSSWRWLVFQFSKVKKNHFLAFLAGAFLALAAFLGAAFLATFLTALAAFFTTFLAALGAFFTTFLTAAFAIHGRKKSLVDCSIDKILSTNCCKIKTDKIYSVKFTEEIVSLMMVEVAWCCSNTECAGTWHCTMMSSGCGQSIGWCTSPIASSRFAALFESELLVWLTHCV